jgi:hypothetical protein
MVSACLPACLRRGSALSQLCGHVLLYVSFNIMCAACTWLPPSRSLLAVWGRWPCRLLVALPCRFSVFSATLCSLCRTTCSSPMTHSTLMGARMIHHTCEVHVSSQCMMGRRHGELGGVGVGVASPDCQVSTHCPPHPPPPVGLPYFRFVPCVTG